MMLMFTMLHHFLDIVNQNRDKKTFKENVKIATNIGIHKEGKKISSIGFALA